MQSKTLVELRLGVQRVCIVLPVEDQSVDANSAPEDSPGKVSLAEPNAPEDSPGDVLLEEPVQQVSSIVFSKEDKETPEDSPGKISLEVFPTASPEDTPGYAMLEAVPMYQC